MDVEAPVATLIDDATTHATAVDENAVGAIGLVEVQNPIRQLCCGDAVVGATGDCTGVSAFAGEEDAIVATEASHIHSKRKWCSSVDEGNLSGHGFVDLECREELEQAFEGELTEEPDADDVIVCASIGGDLAFNVGLVGDTNLAGVNLAMLPDRSKAAALEAVTEAADVAGRVAEGQPDYLGVTIGEGALGCFPNDVRDLGGLVEDDEKALALVVKALPCSGVGAVPWGLVDAPGLSSGWVFAEEGGGCQGVVIPGKEAEVEPLSNLSPSLCFELGFSVGGDDATGVGEGAKGPKGDVGNGGGFGNAVARGDGFLDGGVGVDQTVADAGHEVHGPIFRPLEVLEDDPWLAPRVCPEGEG